MAKNTPTSAPIVESATVVENEMLKRSLEDMRDEYDTFQMRAEERLAQMDNVLEQRGWSEANTYGDSGATLEQLKKAATEIRNLVGLNAHMKRGKNLRCSYVLNGGIHIGKLPTDGRGRGKYNTQELFDNPVNQRNFFSHAAHEERESALYSDSIVVYVGNDTTREIEMSIPIWELGGDYRNPDNAAEVWAYRRIWQHYPQGSATPETRAEWFFTNTHWDKGEQRGPRGGGTSARLQTIKYNGKEEPVAQGKRVFVRNANTQLGWAYGLPDALAAMAWARQYRDFLLSGIKMTKAMSTFAFKLTGKSPNGVAGAGAKVASSTGSARTATMTDGMDLAPMANAGKGYDFSTGGPILAVMAAALDVSKVSLSADSSAAGSSYGAAQTLEGPERMAMMSRRQLHIDLEKEVLAWMGAPDVDVWFDALIDGAELYRIMQSIVLKWNSGLYTAEEIKKELEEVAGRTEIGTIPDGVLLPNNEKSLERKDIDADGSGAAPTTASPTQGQNSGTGQGPDGGNDVRTDTVS